MHPQKRLARIAGLLYLVVGITGPFVLIYVPGKLFVRGDAAATAANLVAHQTLVQAHVFTSVVSELFFVAAVLALFRLLVGLGRDLAAAMAVLVLVEAPLSFLRAAGELAALALARGGEVVAAFDRPQRDALAALLIELNGHGLTVSELFWGLWLVPLGVLVWRSGFIPRFIGAWLVANGAAYVATFAAGVLLPQHRALVTTVAMPIMFGEVALMLWLVAVGARAPKTAPAPPAERAAGA